LAVDGEDLFLTDLEMHANLLEIVLEAVNFVFDHRFQILKVPFEMVHPSLDDLFRFAILVLGSLRFAIWPPLLFSKLLFHR
jgi:hypothetical protein